MNPHPASVSSSPAVMYCMSCKETLSTSCLLIDKHCEHRLLTLQDAVKQELENIKTRSRKLEPKVRRVDVEVSAAKQQLDHEYNKSKEVITGQYTELWTLLEKNQGQASNLLTAEMEALMNSLTRLGNDGHNFQQKIDTTIKNIQQLRKQQKTENPTILLDKIRKLDVSLETIEKFSSSLKKNRFDSMRMRALEDFVRKMFQKNNELLPRPWEFSQTITFNENRKHKDLNISADGSEVSLRGSPTCLSSNQTASWCSVVAVQSFTKGQHYWEVEMEVNGSWVVGLVQRNWINNGLQCPLGRNRKSWALESDNGDVTALHGKDVSVVSEFGINRLGVYVDCDKGRVTFYNISSGSILHSFSTRFKKPLYPVFSLKMETMRTTWIRICTITEDSVQY